MPSLLIATHNRWKARLFGPIFEPYGFSVLTLNNLPAPPPAPQETGLNVLENALIKARYYHSPQYPWVFGDDTGLEIEALAGAPGVKFRRWGGLFSDDVADETWLAHLLQVMESVPPGKRAACFVDGWALIAPSGEEFTCETRAEFEIATRPLRPIPPGAPIMAVATGLPDAPASIFAEAQARWETWGILAQLTQGTV